MLPHPGYFWLALDWHNLIPACQGCNARNGKLNQFPVAKEHATVAPPPGPLPAFNDLDRAEDPLLLHPYADDPDFHLRFGEFGKVVGLTEKGRVSIDVFDLDDDDQRRARWQAQRAAENRARMAVGCRPDDCTLGQARQQVVDQAVKDDSSASEKAEYAAAVRAWLREAQSTL